MRNVFEFTEYTQHKLLNVNPREERHGEALVPAIDLRVRVNLPNKILDVFAPGLRAAHFGAKPTFEDGELDLVVDDLPYLRWRHIKYPIKWAWEGMGYNTAVQWGAGENGSTDIKLRLCKLHNFALTPVNGGTTTVEYTISSAADLEPLTIGRLAILGQQDIGLTTLAPTEGGVLDASSAGDAPKPAKKDKAAAKADSATEEFIARNKGEASAATTASAS